MRCRLRGPGGSSTLNLPDDATVGELISHITEKTSITSFDVKYGYPPRPFPLDESDKTLALSKLEVSLDGEQLTISSREGVSREGGLPKAAADESQSSANKVQDAAILAESFSFVNLPSPEQQPKPVVLQRKVMEGDVPELPLPDRGATMGTYSRVLP